MLRNLCGRGMAVGTDISVMFSSFRLIGQK
jgi:hypothetical protein